MGWKVVVDLRRCTSNGRCMQIAPQVFHVGDDNVLYLLQQEPPDRLRPIVEEAVDRCPMDAITIAES